MTNDPDAPSLPPELAEALQDHPDGRSLAVLWDELGQLTPEASSSTAAGWQAIQRRIHTPPVVVPLAAARPAWPRWLAAAAVLLFVVGAGRGLTRYTDVVATPGETRQVTLPDGSVATLDGGASLRLARGFRAFAGSQAAAREVTLTGNAYFDVTKGTRPFVVRSGDTRVTVLGTRFAVYARPGDHASTTVEVTEGRVAVSQGQHSGLVLSAGERARVASGSDFPTRPELIATSRVAPWRTGGFVVVDERLDVALADLARHSGSQIVLRNATAAPHRVALYYSGATTVDVILRDICTSRGLSFRPIKGGFEVE